MNAVVAHVVRWRPRLVRDWADDPVKAMALGAMWLVLLAVVLYPLALILGYSLRSDDGRIGLGSFAALLSDPDIANAATTSLRYVIEVSLSCLAVGVPLAWLVARTDMPGKWLIRGGAAIAFIVPSFITVIAWIFLLAPNSGYLNAELVAHFGVAPLNVISFQGLVFIESAHLFPLSFFAVSAALGNIDATHEQAARILGAGRLRTAFTVTLPLVTPAVLSSAVLCALEALSSFGAPATIGTMANFNVISTEIFNLLTFPPHLSVAAALAAPVALFTLLLLWGQQRLLRRNKFTTVTGKSSAPQLVALGALRYPLLIIVGCLVGCVSVLPLFALLVLSLLKNFGGDLTLSNLSFAHYASVFDSSFTVLQTVQNSLILATCAATLCLCVSLVLAWIVERTTFAGRGLLVGITTVAFGVPSIILGIGVMLAYIGFFYGTLTIILIAYTARHLPIGFVYLRPLLKQLSPELEEGARVAGATWGRALKDVTFPTLRPGAFLAWLLIFSLCLREQPMSAILAQAGTGVMSTSVLQFIEDGSVGVAAAISVLIVAVSVACLLLAWVVAGRGARPRFH